MTERQRVPAGEAAEQEHALTTALAGERAAAAERRAADLAALAQLRADTSPASRVKAQLRRVKGRRQHAPTGSGVPLGLLPAESAAPLQWIHALPVAGVDRLAIAADLPWAASWWLDLNEPAAVSGWFALRSDAWNLFRGSVELTVRLWSGDTIAAERALRLHPRGRSGDARWVPWRLALPVAGRARLELVTSSPEGAADYGWTVIGDPQLELDRRRTAGGQPLPDAAEHHPAGPAPTISLLMPVHDPPPALLQRTLASVRAQRSDAWQLCIADDGSRDPAVRTLLHDAAASDDRIRLARHERAGGISAATNAALELATGTFVATLDHDDLLAPAAIAAVAGELAARPGVDVLYTDNDLVAGAAGEELGFAAALKPDWSPDLLRACMYTLHLGVYRRALVEQIGGWRSEFDGAQDHDLVLRLSEQTQQIAHVPGILAHWRAHAGSAALGELAKPQAYERGRLAVAEHLERAGIDGAVQRLPWPGRFRTVLERRDPVVVVLPDGAEEATVASWQAVLRDGDELRTDRASSLPALAAQLPPDAIVLLVEAEAIPDDAGAVDELLGHVEAGAAAAGGIVTDAGGRLLAGALAWPSGLPAGLHLGADTTDEQRHPSLTMVSNRSAVRGVVALRAGALGGAVPAAATSLALVARTLELSLAGGRVVWSPHARFTATQAGASVLATTSLRALRALGRSGWQDPFWNPLRRSDLADESYDAALHERSPA